MMLNNNSLKNYQLSEIEWDILDDLALLHFRQLELRKSFAGIDVVLNSSISPLPLLQE